MNGEDLKFLAARASTVEGHAADRVAEVHARIRLARRRRVVAAAGALVLVVTLGGAGLGRSLTADPPIQPTDQPPGWCTKGPAVAPGTRVGVLGMPPEGATPSSTNGAELVLEWFGVEIGGGKSNVWLYDDGRLIVQRETTIPEGAAAGSTGYLERCLTPQGVEAIRSYAMSSGVRSDAVPPPYPVWLKVREGDRFVDFNPFGISTRRLTEPQSWLPDSAWVDKTYRGYVPSSYAVCYAVLAHDKLAPTRVLDSLPAQASDLLRSKGRTANPVVADQDCAVVTTEEARLLVAILRTPWRTGEFGSRPYVLDIGLDSRAPDTGSGTGTTAFGYIGINPVLPDGQWSCNCG